MLTRSEMEAVRAYEKAYGKNDGCCFGSHDPSAYRRMPNAYAADVSEEDRLRAALDAPKETSSLPNK